MYHLSSCITRQEYLKPSDCDIERELHPIPNHFPCCVKITRPVTRPGRGAAAVTVEHVDGGGGVAAVVGVEEVRPLRGQHAGQGHNNLLTGEYISSGARRRWTDRRYYTGNMSRPRCYTAVRKG